MPTKPSNPDHNTPPKDSVRRNKQKKKVDLPQVNCLVCGNKITEANEEGGRGWHSNIFCTPIFFLDQDESQRITTEIAGGQKSNCLLAGKESTSHFT